MAQPFHERLRDYFTKVGLVLQGSADVASVFPNPTDIGMSREGIYAEVLRQHLPRNCNVFFGGFAFNADGQESRQIDILVTADAALQFNFYNRDGSGKSFTSIDGCIGAVSVKSRLTTAELEDALSNLATLPDKESLEGRINPLYKVIGYEDWPYKVIYASGGVNLETCQAGLKVYYDAHPEVSMNKRVNLIHVAGKYAIVRVPRDIQFEDGVTLPEGAYASFVTDVDARALLMVVIELQVAAQSSSQIVFKHRNLLDMVQKGRI